MKNMRFVTALIITLFVLMPGCVNSPSEDTYKVTYNANIPSGETLLSGTATVDSANYEQGDAVQVQGNTGNLALTNYLFYDWNTSADGSGTTYMPGDVFLMGNKNVTLYAEWCDAAQWAQTATQGSDYSVFNSVAVDSSGKIYAAGEIHGTGTFDFGNGKTATVTGSDGNAVLVKY